MSNSKKYYEAALAMLADDCGYDKQIVISDGIGNKTKTLNLNVDSIQVLIKWLEKEYQKIK